MRASTGSRPHWAAPHPPFPRHPERTAHSGAAVYRRREPTATALYPIVQHHLQTFLALAAEADPGGEGVPGWVEDDFRAYLRCGILAWGFARVRCDVCAAERLVAFSCKGRGVCPSCNARRMVEVAAHLTDHVLPPLPVRQWVLSDKDPPSYQASSGGKVSPDRKAEVDPHLETEGRGPPGRVRSTSTPGIRLY